VIFPTMLGEACDGLRERAGLEWFRLVVMQANLESAVARSMIRYDGRR
jgi:hypothetical protein